MRLRGLGLLVTSCIVGALAVTQSCSAPAAAQDRALLEELQQERRELLAELAAKERRVHALEQDVARLESQLPEAGSGDGPLAARARTGSGRGLGLPPLLEGTVTSADQRQCVVKLTNNPGNVDIEKSIARRPFRFALYDEDGYKAECVATRYDASANAVLCRVVFRKDGVVLAQGDKAATRY